MATKVLPYIGEYIPGQLNPGEVKVAHCRLAFSGGDVNTGAVQATYNLFKFTMAAILLEVMAYTPTAWTTSVTITLGDTNAAAGWMASAKIAPTSAQTNGIMKATDVSTADTYAGGLLIAGTAAAPYILTATVGGANPAVGITDVYVRFVETALL